MAVPNDPSPVKMVIHIATHDGETNVTHVFDNVHDFNMALSTASAYSDDVSTRAYHTPKAELSLSGIAFPLNSGQGQQFMKTYDNKVAKPNLDDFLLTFSKHERIEMAKAYVKKTEAEIQKTLEDLGVDILRNYLEKNGFDVVPEGELEE